MFKLNEPIGDGLQGSYPYPVQYLGSRAMACFPEFVVNAAGSPGLDGEHGEHGVSGVRGADGAPGKVSPQIPHPSCFPDDWLQAVSFSRPLCHIRPNGSRCVES